MGSLRFHKAVAGERIEFADVLDGETVDDDITLSCLIALHGVDADLFQFRDAQLSMPLRTMAIWLR